MGFYISFFLFFPALLIGSLIWIVKAMKALFGRERRILALLWSADCPHGGWSGAKGTGSRSVGFSRGLFQWRIWARLTSVGLSRCKDLG
jgi:hypothetical protein